MFLSVCDRTPRQTSLRLMGHFLLKINYLSIPVLYLPTPQSYSGYLQLEEVQVPPPGKPRVAQLRHRGAHDGGRDEPEEEAGTSQTGLLGGGEGKERQDGAGYVLLLILLLLLLLLLPPNSPPRPVSSLLPGPPPAELQHTPQRTGPRQ